MARHGPWAMPSRSLFYEDSVHLAPEMSRRWQVRLLALPPGDFSTPRMAAFGNHLAATEHWRAPSRLAGRAELVLHPRRHSARVQRADRRNYDIVAIPTPPRARAPTQPAASSARRLGTPFAEPSMRVDPADSAKPLPAPVSSSGGGDNPHFAAIGGEAGVARLVDCFYRHMLTMPEAASIRALHPVDLEPVRRVLERYLTEWLGGPALYSAQPGHPRLRRRHKRFSIGPAERDAWLACMRAALAEVVPDATLRAVLDAAFVATAEYLRNDPEHAHVHHGDEHHHGDHHD